MHVGFIPHSAWIQILQIARFFRFFRSQKYNLENTEQVILEFVNSRDQNNVHRCAQQITKRSVWLFVCLTPVIWSLFWFHCLVSLIKFHSNAVWCVRQTTLQAIQQNSRLIFCSALIDPVPRKAELQEIHPHDWHGTGKEGHPMFFDRFGICTPEVVLKAFRMDELDKSHEWVLENGRYI